MLTFRQLDDLPDSVVKIMSQAEQSIINDMARRIASIGDVTAGTNWQAQRLEMIGAAQDNVVKELSRALRMTEQQTADLFDEAATRTLSTDNAIYKAAGYNPVPLAENRYLQQLILAGLTQTNNEFRNLTRTTANTATRQFEDVLDRAHTEIATGGMDYQRAIKNAIRELSSKGIASISYSSGHIDHLDVAARRAVLTGINQVAAEVQIANATQLGVDLVETTAHHSARPSHAVWQGQVFSISGNNPRYQSFYPATGYGTGEGLCGWNCRHSFFPFFEGLSKDAYSLDTLRDYNRRAVMYNGEAMSLYDATQQQRYIERQIRRWKREAAAMESAGIDNGRAKRKVRDWQAVQRDFIDQTGLSRDYFRERGGAQLGVYVPRTVVKLPAERIPRSLGAKGINYDISDPHTGAVRNLVEGTYLQDIKVFAGRGTKTALHEGVAEGLTRQYGGEIKNWQHVKAYGIIDVNGEHIKAEIHWFQEESVGRVKFKIKEWIYED